MPISGLVAPVAGDPASEAPIRSPLSAVPGTPELSGSSPCRCRWSAPCPRRGPCRRPHRERPRDRRPRTRTARSTRLLRAGHRPRPNRPSRRSSGRRSGPCRSVSQVGGDAGDGHRAGVRPPCRRPLRACPPAGSVRPPAGPERDAPRSRTGLPPPPSPGHPGWPATAPGAAGRRDRCPRRRPGRHPHAALSCGREARHAHRHHASADRERRAEGGPRRGFIGAAAHRAG